MIQQSLIKSQKAEIEAINKSMSLETLKAVEDKVLEDSISIVQHCLNFAEMGFDENGREIVPEEWDDLPLREKEKRIRLAKAVWMPSADVPHGVKMAQETMIGIIKSRAKEQSGTKVLHIENATFPSPAPLNNLEVIDIED